MKGRLTGRSPPRHPPQVDSPGPVSSRAVWWPASSPSCRCADATWSAAPATSCASRGCVGAVTWWRPSGATCTTPPPRSSTSPPAAARLSPQKSTSSCDPWGGPPGVWTERGGGRWTCAQPGTQGSRASTLAGGWVRPYSPPQTKRWWLNQESPDANMNWWVAGVKLLPLPCHDSQCLY